MLLIPNLREMSDRLTSTLLKEAFGHYPSGVVAVCAQADGEPIGMAASSFTWVSFDPPLVGFFADRRSRTWQKLRSHELLGVSVLSHLQRGIARQLASRSGDRFEGVEMGTSPGGAPLLNGATATFECRVYSESDAGDHVLVLLEVLAMDADRHTEPLVYHLSGFRALTAPE
jgi:flavin reductase (DIM6/NTAB) family NADH-FMN oxidoreductase RutF